MLHIHGLISSSQKILQCYYWIHFTYEKKKRCVSERLSTLPEVTELLKIEVVSKSRIFKIFSKSWAPCIEPACHAQTDNVHDTYRWFVQCLLLNVGHISDVPRENVLILAVI